MSHSKAHDDEAADPAPTIRDFFVYLVDEDDAAAARERFCDAVSLALGNVASWLAVDSWTGAGDVEDTSERDRVAPDPVRSRSFVAVALVAQISSELTSGALLLYRERNEYAASALVRQLIECEYLLRVFGLNFAEAARWYEATDRERWDFAPSKLRQIAGFDRKEYADHCESGGHPNPSGRRLIKLARDMQRLAQAAAGQSADLNFVRALWLDFTFHCDRTWRALADLLAAEHARFERVGRTRKSIDEVAEARDAWQRSDVLGANAGWVLEALSADPATPLDELLHARTRQWRDPRYSERSPRRQRPARIAGPCLVMLGATPVAHGAASMFFAPHRAPPVPNLTTAGVGTDTDARPRSVGRRIGIAGCATAGRRARCPSHRRARRTTR